MHITSHLMFVCIVFQTCKQLGEKQEKFYREFFRIIEEK